MNLTLLTLNDANTKDMKPIKSLQTFDGVSKNFIADGLFSTEIFGLVGEERRNRTFAYIDLRINIFHPIVHRAFLDLKRLHGKIMDGTQYVLWDDELKEFVKSDAVSGFTGYEYFLSKVDKFDLTIKKEYTNKRKNTLKLLARYKDSWFMNKLLVLPAGLRDYEVGADGKPSEGEVNSYYRRVMSFANNVVVSAIKTNPEALDGLRYNLQEAVNDIYDYFESLLKGKNKLVLAKWASRKVFNSTRNVLTLYVPRSTDLDKMRVGTNHTIYGLFQFLKTALPLAIFQIKNGFMRTVFPGQNYPMSVTDPKTLKRVTVDFDHASYDKWMTNEGIEKIINQFGNDTFKSIVVKIGDSYAGLVYRDDTKFMFFQDIDELDPALDRKFVTPITYVELLYHSVYKVANDVPVTNTRYPITGIGSIYPSLTYLQPTMKGISLEEYVDNQPTGSIALEYPVGTDYFSGVSVAMEHHKRLTADMDGDTVSTIAMLSEEARAEVKDLLGRRSYYVENNKIIYSANTAVINQVVAFMTAKD
jgi:hypothetical protein